MGSCQKLNSIEMWPPTAPSCHWRKRRLRYVADLWQLSDKPLLACVWVHGVPVAKDNSIGKLNLVPPLSSRRCRAPRARNLAIFDFMRREIDLWAKVLGGMKRAQ